MCVVLVSCRRRCDVITPRQHRCDVILNHMPAGRMSNSCCVGSSLMQNPLLSTIEVCQQKVNVSQLTSKWNVPYLFFRLNSFSISEEYASVYCRNYASHRISESYAERILFFFTTYPTPPLPLPCHTGGFCILGLCILVSIFVMLNMAF